MSTISAAAVNELRKRTNQPLMDCKRALTESDGDMEKAVLYLRARNKTVGDKRGENEVAEGRIGIFIDPAKAVAAIVEMRCESAPSAKSEQFVKLAKDIAEAAARHDAADVPALMGQALGSGTVKERVDETVGLIREKMIIQRFARLSGGVFGQYIHHDGTVGVLLQCHGEPKGDGADEALRDICAHAAALNPLYLKPDEVPADQVQKEKDLALAQIKEDPKNASKPANIVEKIAEGKLKTWMSETVLTEQPLANAMKYPGTTVGQLLQKFGLTPAKFVRFKVGAVSL